MAIEDRRLGRVGFDKAGGRRKFGIEGFGLKALKQAEDQVEVRELS